MKSLRIMFCVAVLAVASVASAQTKPGDLVVDVPFDFIVGSQTLPAGHYIVQTVSNSRIRIFNSTTPGAYVMTHGALRPKSDGSKLVFHRYEHSYFLSSMWVTGNTTGRELAPSRAEHEAAAHAVEMELAVVRPGGPSAK